MSNGKQKKSLSCLNIELQKSELICDYLSRENSNDIYIEETQNVKMGRIKKNKMDGRTMSLFIDIYK